MKKYIKNIILHKNLTTIAYFKVNLFFSWLQAGLSREARGQVGPPHLTAAEQERKDW